MKFTAASKGLIGAGGALCTVFSVLGFFASDYMVDGVAEEMSELTPGSHAWESWRSGSKLIKFYFFNISNPDAIQQGEKIIVKEVGPYIYRVNWEKTDISVDTESESIKYKTSNTYSFDPELNDGLESDKITFINLIFVSTAITASKHVKEDFLMEQLEQMLISKGERLTKADTVRNIVIDGVSIKPYSDIFRNPATKDIIEDLGFEIPLVAKEGKFSLLKKVNPQEEGWIEINSGKTDKSKMGNILTYDTMAELPYWSSQTCNDISASDGSTFPPELNKATLIRIYVPGMCRTMTFVFNSTETTKKQKAYRFITNMEDWKSGKTKPENNCYCPNDGAGEGKNDVVCSSDGVYSISSCTNGAPLVLSLPHFMGANDEISSKVTGLQPEMENHITVIDFQPETGKVVQAYFRVQLNVELKPIVGFKTFTSVKHAIVPFAWTEELSEITESDLLGLSSVDKMKTIVILGRLGVFGTGLILLAAGFIIAKKGRHQSPVQVVSESFNNEMYKSNFF